MIRTPVDYRCTERSGLSITAILQCSIAIIRVVDDLQFERLIVA